MASCLVALHRQTDDKKHTVSAQQEKRKNEGGEGWRQSARWES